ncbi:hypothetical protein AgCh_022257 [Apium graveolens]
MLKLQTTRSWSFLVNQELLATSIFRDSTDKGVDVIIGVFGINPRALMIKVWVQFQRGGRELVKQQRISLLQIATGTSEIGRILLTSQKRWFCLLQLQVNYDQNMYGGNAALKASGALSVAVPRELAGLHKAWE